MVPLLHRPQGTDQIDTLQLQHHQSYLTDQPQNCTDPREVDHGTEDFREMHIAYDSGFFNFGCDDDAKVEAASYNNNNLRITSLETVPSGQFYEPTIKCWNTNFLEDNATMNLESLAFLLNPEEWP